MAGVRATQFGLQNSENQTLVANAKNALLGKAAVTRSTRTALGELGNKAGANRTALRAKDTNIPGISIHVFICPTLGFFYTSTAISRSSPSGIFWPN